VSDQIIAAIIGALKEEQQVQLEALGKFPKSDPFEHGLSVGCYRGMADALNIVTAILRDEAEEEARR